MTQPEYLFVTGRLVQGSVFEPQTKNMTGGPLTDRQGNPKVQYFCAIAVAKTDPGLAETIQKIQAIAAAGFPGGETGYPTFAWKQVDGDTPPHNTKAGFPGCQIFRLTSGFPVQAVTQGGASTITDPTQMKRGDYVRAAFTCKPNGDATKPGVYLNLSFVEFIGFGEAINAGPDAAAILGGIGAAAMPTGASATPVASGPPMQPPATPGLPTQPGAAVAPVTPGMPAAQPTPGMPAAQPTPGMPAAQPTPGMPAAQPTPGMPAAQPDFLTPPAMTAKAGGAAYQQFINQGWTDEQLIAQGYMAPR